MYYLEIYHVANSSIDKKQKVIKRILHESFRVSELTRFYTTKFHFQGLFNIYIIASDILLLYNLCHCIVIISLFTVIILYSPRCSFGKEYFEMGAFSVSGFARRFETHKEDVLVTVLPSRQQLIFLVKQLT